MSTSETEASTTPTNRPASSGGHTGWMIATFVLALGVVGLGVWALTLDSDNKDLAKQTAALTTRVDLLVGVGGQLGSQLQGTQTQLDDATKRYKAAMVKLGASSQTIAEAEQTLTQVKTTADQAAQAAASASDDLEKKAAAESARADQAEACLKATVAVFEKPYTGLGATTALDRAATELQQITVYCSSS